MSCFSNGYKLVCGNTKNGNTYVKCERYVLSPKSKATNQQTKSSKPTCIDNWCQFSLTIQYDMVHKQMFLRRNSGCCLLHCGHFMIPLKKRTTGTKDLHDIELGKLHEFVLRNFPSNVIQDFIE